MTVYVDSSVVLRIMLDEPGAFLYSGEWDVAVTSELLRVEALRTLDRLRVRGKVTDSYLADKLRLLGKVTSGFRVVPIGPAVLARTSSPFRTELGTLDAIHLATALLWMEERDEPLTFLTHDAQQALAARACGLEVRTAP